MTRLDTPGPGRNRPSVGDLGRRAVRMEIHGYLSIFRFVFRRPRVPAGSVGFSYDQGIRMILMVFVVLSAVELVIVDLIVMRWPYVRISMLFLGVWGLVYLFGLLFGMLTRPHAVGRTGIRVRQGETDIPLRWNDIVAVTRRKHVILEKQPRVTVDPAGAATLHLRVQKETNIEITLDRALPLRLPYGVETVRVIALYADDPTGFLAAVRQHINS